MSTCICLGIVSIAAAVELAVIVADPAVLVVVEGDYDHIHC